MSLAENLLNSLDEAAYTGAQTTFAVAEEGHIIVNADRTITVPNELKNIAVTGDDDIETVTFDCVRYWDGHDLSTFAIYLNYILPDGTTGTYVPKSITSSDGESFYHFDWEIKGNITQNSGKIAFGITAIKTKLNENGETVVDRQWSSFPNADCSIVRGIGISNVPPEEDAEGIVAQLSAMLEEIQSILPQLVIPEIVQSTGESETAVMSQKAVTAKFKEYDKEFYRQTYSDASPVLLHINNNGFLIPNYNKNVSFEDPAFAKKGSTITVDEGYKFQVALYNAETMAFIERITWMQHGTVYTLDDDYYVRAEISDVDENVLADTSIFVHLKYVLYKSMESTISRVETYAEETQSASMDNASAIVDAIGIDFFKGKTFTITRPIKYNAWPFIGHTNGKLVCVYAKGNTHADVYTGAIYAKTSYNGVVWSTEKMVINTPNIRNTITGKGIDSNGNMLVWGRKGSPSSSPSTTFHLYKTSDGNEFHHVSSPVFSTYPGHIGDIINVPNVGLMAFFNTYRLDTWAYGVVKSTDNGMTWTQTVIESGLTKSECPTEISGVYVGDGKIFAIGRKEDVGDFDYAMFQIQSNDGGQTWTKQRTNITDCVLSTPSLIYDESIGELTLYYYQRVVGALRMRKNKLSDVWSNPTSWGDSIIIANGSTETNNAGNVNAVAFNDIHMVTFYSGNSDNTGIYGVIK